MSDPSDPAERQADRVASKVRAGKGGCGADCGGGCATCGATGVESPIAASLSSPSQGGFEVDGELGDRVSALEGRGQPLGAGERRWAASELGHDFSGVRIHTDGQAGETAAALGASAFTFGRNIAFAPGRFQPASPDGRALLAHELTHVVQQSQGATPGVARSMPRTIMRQDEEEDATGSGGTAAHPPVVSTTARPGPIRIAIWIKAFIPGNVSGARTVGGGPHAGKTAVVPPFPASIWEDCFLTDQRGFDSSITASARMTSMLYFETDGVSSFNEMVHHSCGTTHEVDCSSGAAQCTKTASTSRMFFSTVRWSSGTPPSPYSHFGGAAGNPCATPACDIDYSQGIVMVDLVAREFKVQVLTDFFPAYEMYAMVNGRGPTTLFQLSPRGGLSGLCGRSRGVHVKVPF